jgi:ribosome maturation factor RimP
MALDIEKIRAICERVCTSLGLELVDVEFRGGAGKQGRVLRITIDRAVGMPGANASMSDGSAAGNVAETSSPTPSPQVAEAPKQSETVMGVSHEDCANVSREVGTILDVEDAVPGTEYMLEVSSPGLDRKLQKATDFQRFTGSRIKVMTFDPVGVTEKSKGNRHFEGRLERFADGRLVIDVNAGAAKSKGKKKNEKLPPSLVEVELTNVERANLVPEI